MRSPAHPPEHPWLVPAEAPEYERPALSRVDMVVKAEGLGVDDRGAPTLRLAPGDTLELSFDALGSRLGCRVLAGARRAEQADATAAAASLARQLEALVPVQRTAAEHRGTLSGSNMALQPDAVLLSCRRGAGFTTEGAAPALRLPLPTAAQVTPAARLQAALAALEPGLGLGVTLSAFRLPAPVLDILAAFAAGERVARYAATGAPVSAPSALSALLEQTEAWLRHGAGIRLRWRLSVSAAPGAGAGAGAQLRLAELLTDGGVWRATTTRAPSVWDLSTALPGLTIPLPLPGRAAFRARPCADVEGATRAAVCLGVLEQGAAPRPVVLRDADRAQHCYVLGASGTGKSSLLAGMIGQDIAAGRGVCVLDPHGDLTADVLARVPARRLRDLVLVDPGDTTRAPGLNLLEPSPGVPAERHAAFAINEMMRIFARLYDLSVAGGPMFEKYMRNALSLVMENRLRGGTLVDVPWLFEDRDYRDALLANCTNPYTLSFWRKEAEAVRGDGALANMAPYITCKLNQFTHNAVLRPIIGQSQGTLDLGACMRDGRILLVNLAKGALGSLDARLLGMLLLAKLLAEAMARGHGTARAPYYLYVDEAQSFATETMAELLAEARKFGLHLTLANQNLGQLDATAPGLRDALLGNAGNLLLMRVGPADAALVQSWTAPQIDAQQLQFLGNYRVAARMLVDGEPALPFVFRTEPLPPVPRRNAAASARRAETLSAVRRSTTRPVTEVEEALQGRRRRVLASA